MNRLSDAWTRLVTVEGSTRSVGLMRVALVALIWRKYCEPLNLSRVFHDSEMLLYTGLFYLFTVAMFVGFWSRASTLATGLLLTFLYGWLGVHGGQDFYVHHHTYLLGLLPVFLAGTDVGGSFSLDRWLALRRADQAGQPPPAEHGVLWGLWLVQLQIAAVYWLSAWDKSFLRYGERMEHYFMNYWFGSDDPPFWGFSTGMAVAGLVTVLLEYWLPIGLWSRRQRGAALLVGFVLHSALFLGLRVSTFSATMWVAYVAFLDPAAVHAAIDRMVGERRP